MGFIGSSSISLDTRGHEVLLSGDKSDNVSLSGSVAERLRACFDGCSSERQASSVPGGKLSITGRLSDPLSWNVGCSKRAKCSFGTGSSFTGGLLNFRAKDTTRLPLGRLQQRHGMYSSYACGLRSMQQNRVYAASSAPRRAAWLAHARSASSFGSRRCGH